MTGPGRKRYAGIGHPRIALSEGYLRTNSTNRPGHLKTYLHEQTSCHQGAPRDGIDTAIAGTKLIHRRSLHTLLSESGHCDSREQTETGSCEISLHQSEQNLTERNGTEQCPSLPSRGSRRFLGRQRNPCTATAVCNDEYNRAGKHSDRAEA
jgi:hypothetical protein